jgi:hypothetical protein
MFHPAVFPLEVEEPSDAHEFPFATRRSADELTPAALTTLLRRYDPDVSVTELDVHRTWQGATSHLYVNADYADLNTAVRRNSSS